MTDYVTIANSAAQLIGTDDQLRTPDDDTHIGRTFKTSWDLVRQAAIRDHTWNFATRRAALAADADILADEIHPWGYSFPLPSKSLRLVEVMGIDRARYQVEGQSILCNSMGPLRIRYLIDVPEMARWDAMFVSAFAHRMAWQTGKRIAGSDYDMDGGWKLYQRALAEAKRVDARENPPIEFEPTSWETARGIGDGCRVDSNGMLWP